MMQVDHIHFSFGAHPVLTDVHFHLPQKSIMGILGPNGSGKTTLLKIMGGLLTPKSGTIQMEGIEKWNAAHVARQIAYVPQETVCTFPYRAIELVLLGRLPYTSGFSFATKEDYHIAYAALDACDAASFCERRVTELSGGERQRVILARAIAQQPRLLLLDEPTTFLDIRHQAGVMALLQRWVANTGGSVGVVFHDLNLASQICSHVALLKAGRLLACGTTDQTLIYNHVCETFDTDVYVGMNELNQRPFFVPMSP